MPLPLRSGGVADVMPTNNSTKDVNPESADDKIRRTLLRVRQDVDQGKPTTTLNEDGSGTMLVQLSGVEAFLFASELRIDMTWSLDRRKLTKKTVGGDAADQVNLVPSTLGDIAHETHLQVTDDRLPAVGQGRHHEIRLKARHAV